MMNIYSEELLPLITKYLLYSPTGGLLLCVWMDHDYIESKMNDCEKEQNTYKYTIYIFLRKEAITQWMPII